MTGLGSVRAWWRGLNPRLIHAAITLGVLVLVGLPLAPPPLTAGQRRTAVWASLLGVALCVPFASHRRYPVAAISVACGALILYALGKYAAYPGFPVFVLVFGISLHSTRRQAALAAGLGA